MLQANLNNSSSLGNCANKFAMAKLFTALGIPAFKSYCDNCSNHQDILQERIGYCNKALIAWDCVISHTSQARKQWCSLCEAYTIAKHALFALGQRVSMCFKVRLMWQTGCLMSLLSSWVINAPMAYELVAKQRSNSLQQIGACTVERFVIICCNLLKAICCASPHSKLCPFLSNLVKAKVIDAKPGMNLQMYETFPKKLFNSFIVANSFMVAMVVVMAGSTSIPLLWTKKPRNVLKDTPKAHLRGFILNLKARHLSNTFLNIWT